MVGTHGDGELLHTQPIQALPCQHLAVQTALWQQHGDTQGLVDGPWFTAFHCGGRTGWDSHQSPQPKLLGSQCLRSQRGPSFGT